ncbi:BNR/Asp-box repeat protein [Rubripirellula lacrimiformis]|uniref:BNR/Asp-box repeat protein n=1 Tax=Rubripirellula lacrimiformis TaxID=1930273 RepID=A0A517NEE7_9BACT|nr:sialidase family protein [Rubripirellula lacrimiformis]QDT05509.1 BNR/Asp-box repeat protein [Rubripirellula lacrimiformis]
MKSFTAFQRAPIVPLILVLSILSGDQLASAVDQGSTTVKQPITSQRAASPLYLTANDLSIATGKPSLVMMSSGSTHIPVWSLSGGTVRQSVAGIVNGLPDDCVAVQVEIVVTSTDPGTNKDLEDVYRVHLSQMVQDAPFTERYALGKPVRTPLPAGPLHSRTIVLESYYEVVPNAPLTVRIQREPGLPGDTFTRPTGLAVVKVTPLSSLAEAHTVQDVSGYNSWPMTQAIGDKLVCTYSRGSAHSIGEDARAVYARTSTDGGKTWTAETVVANTPGYGEVTVGKGLDSTGAMLLWVRRVGKERNHDLYRTTDGVTFTLVATPKLAVQPMQITDVFAVPDVGLMALWFAGNYSDKAVHSWGMMTSHDDGATWTQTPIESGLMKADWPTEPSAVYLGDGKILAVARTENGPAQFQVVSTDNGATWTRQQTNIGDIYASTPSLILDTETGLLSNYYYERARGILRRRVVHPDVVFDHPLDWPASQAVTTGSPLAWDSGNANATMIGDTHYVSYYSGKAPDTAVMVLELPEPTDKDARPTPDGSK